MLRTSHLPRPAPVSLPYGPKSLFLLYTPRCPVLCPSLQSALSHPNWPQTVAVAPNISRSCSGLLLSLQSLLLSVASTSWTSGTLDTPRRIFLSLNKKAAHFPQVTLTAKSWDVLQFLTSAPLSFPLTQNLLPKQMASSYFHFYHVLTSTILCSHDVINVPAFGGFSTRLPVSSLPHAPPSFWMTSMFLRKTHPPLQQLLTAFASQFWLFLPWSHTRLFHNPELCGPIVFIFRSQNFSYPCFFPFTWAQDH